MAAPPPPAAPAESGPGTAAKVAGGAATLGKNCCSRLIQTLKNVEHMPVAKVQKELSCVNKIVGVMLFLVTGVLQFVLNFLSSLGLTVLLNPSQLAIQIYCMFFGMLLLAFEFSRSEKIANYFRTNFGFFMTYNGRAAFLFFIGFFSMGAGQAGVVTGVLSFGDALFHVWCRFKNPGMKDAIRNEDSARLEGTYQAQAGGGLVGKVMDMGAEDPNKLKAMGKMGAGVAGNVAAGGTGNTMKAAAGLASMQAQMNAPAPAPAPNVYGAPAPAPAPPPPSRPTMNATPAPATSDFVVDDYALDDDGTAI